MVEAAIKQGGTWDRRGIRETVVCHFSEQMQTDVSAVERGHEMHYREIRVYVIWLNRRRKVM